MSSKEWYDRGVDEGKKYMMTCRDMSDYSWYPVYFDTHSEFEKHSKDAEQVAEVYDLSISYEEQAKAGCRKVWNPPPAPPMPTAESAAAAPAEKKPRIETIVVGDEPVLFVMAVWSPDPKKTSMWMFSLSKDEEAALLKRKRENGSILVDCNEKMDDLPSLAPGVEGGSTAPAKMDGAGNVRLDAYATIEMVVLHR